MEDEKEKEKNKNKDFEYFKNISKINIWVLFFWLIEIYMSEYNIKKNKKMYLKYIQLSSFNN